MAVISVLLCLTIVFGSVSVCAAGDAQPEAANDKVSVNFIFVNFRSEPNFSFSSIKKIFFYGRKVKVLRYEGYFTYVQDVQTEEKGYIFSVFLDDDEEGKLSVTPEDFSAYEGRTRNSLIKINYNGNRTVRWSIDKSGIVEITEGDDGNLNVKGISPGTVTLTITAGFESETCTVNCVYKWKKSWTGKANKSADIMKGAGSDYEKWTTISSGDKFIVYGDDGDSDGWAYGNVSGTDYWGFVKIEDISTKGTVSQYNSMGWKWPLKNVEYNYINSPYGTRITSPKKHKGFDISTNWEENQPSIEGETIVSAFNGTVDYVCIDSSLSWGYCVSIISDDEIIDPVSRKQFVAIYMHMKNKPKVSRGKEVSSGTELGYVGNTGNSTGAHLHFDVNNQTASIYESDGKEASDVGRSSYNDLINPIFFYMSFNPKYNKTSEAEKNYYGTYWYGSE